MTASAFESEIDQSIAYLRSAAAYRSLEADAYWPKWNSPWWHMLLLHEMGETQRIPESIVAAYVEALDRIPIKIFPIRPSDMPAGVDPHRGAPCHCQIGNVYQVLVARGVDVDASLPWIRPWFVRYQMADGGFNCDESAYLVNDEVPSSMVGTIAIFEAMLLCKGCNWNDDERAMLDKSAAFLIERQLVRGSNTRHNAVERVSAESWSKMCFPRFYQYDTMRGLNALTRWASMTGGRIPNEAVREAVSSIRARFPDGELRNERNPHAGATTRAQNSEGAWERAEASDFPLLRAVSAVGAVNPVLSEQWRAISERLATACGAAQ